MWPSKRECVPLNHSIVDTCRRFDRGILWGQSSWNGRVDCELCDKEPSMHLLEAAAAEWLPARQEVEDRQICVLSLPLGLWLLLGEQGVSCNMWPP